MNPREFDRIEARFKQYVMHQVVDEGILFDVEPAVIHDAWGDLVFGLKAKILSDDLPPQTVTKKTFVHYRVPASTWQMFKKRHAQSWWLWRLVERRPVEYSVDPDGRGEYAVCTLNLERFRVYPESRLKASEHGRMVMLYDARAEWSAEQGEL